MEHFVDLTQSSDPFIALLAAINVLLSGVIVYQWNYTTRQTVPKWIWDEFVSKVDTMLTIMNRLDERVKK
jgi:hypothetical protein